MKHLQSNAGHIIILDAGSTGSRIHVFSYQSPASGGHYPHLSLSGVFAQVNPGLASFEDEPSEAGAHLRPLISAASAQVRCAGATLPCSKGPRCWT